MNPAVWLIIWLASTGILCTLAAMGAYPVGYDRGYDEGSERHRHRRGDPQVSTLLELPRPGRLPVDPTYGGKVHDIHGGPGQDCWCGYVGHDPVPMRQSDTGTWRFAGGWDRGPAVGEIVGNAATNDPPLSDTGEMRALTDARIAKWEGDTNEFIHSMPRVTVRAD